jgi:hypothetical protein
MEWDMTEDEISVRGPSREKVGSRAKVPCSCYAAVPHTKRFEFKDLATPRAVVI